MPWWVWMVIGSILLVAELSLVDLEFYLVFLGISAFVVGFLVVGDPTLGVTAQWLIFAGLAVVSLVFFRQRVYRLIRKHAPDRPPRMVGKKITLPSSVAPGESCRVEVQGTTWTATNETQETLEAGSRVSVVRTDGVTLVIERAG